MRRIGADGAAPVEGKPRIGAALGAVAVHHVGRVRAMRRMTWASAAKSPGQAWRRMGMRVSPNASEGSSARKAFVRARAAGAVRDQPDAVAARDLLRGQIEHMAEQAADRRAKHVQNVQRRHG